MKSPIPPFIDRFCGTEKKEDHRKKRIFVNLPNPYAAAAACGIP